MLGGERCVLLNYEPILLILLLFDLASLHNGLFQLVKLSLLSLDLRLKLSEESVLLIHSLSINLKDDSTTSEPLFKFHLIT